MNSRLTFRLRYDPDDPDELDVEQEHRCQEQYCAHLEAIASSQREDAILFAFFGFSNVFHDMHIRSVAFAPNGNSVTIIMNGCLVVNANDEETDVGHGIALRFHFHGVQWFQSDSRVPYSMDWILREIASGPPRVFLLSEIDSLTELIEAAEARARAEVDEDGDEAWSKEAVRYHSLLIRTADPRGTIGIVFQFLDMEPEEPLAWALLSAHPQFRVPVLTLEMLQKKG